MKDDSIEGLLSNLKKTLEGRKSGGDSDPYVLKNPVNVSGSFSKNDLIKKRASKIVSEEIGNSVSSKRLIDSIVSDFFDSQEGKAYLFEVVDNYIRNNKKQLSEIIKKIVLQKFNEIL